MGPLKELLLDVLPDNRDCALTCKELNAKFPTVPLAAITHALRIQKKYRLVDVWYEQNGFKYGHWWRVK